MAITMAYGNVRLLRKFCNDCKETNYFIKGVCNGCGKTGNGKARTRKWKMVSQPFLNRKAPPKKYQTRIILKQGNKCLYCENPFGEMFYSLIYNKAMVRKPVWDHRIPFSYSMNNQKENFVAACAICNGIKSNLMFESLEDARDYIKHRRKKKGYDKDSETNNLSNL